eukprot:TRINITY_DN105533_c0_g1_i1.p1 TRINITY_DN105533_c0_g1~~TRINITY_DN105533_c0_g1_i1.p1  ORF type:complete len:287 (+),score=38.35 TRINITY_DN105533_c0_g1_i1:125-862(+)
MGVNRVPLSLRPNRTNVEGVPVGKPTQKSSMMDLLRTPLKSKPKGMPIDQQRDYEHIVEQEDYWYDNDITPDFRPRPRRKLAAPPPPERRRHRLPRNEDRPIVVRDSSPGPRRGDYDYDYQGDYGRGGRGGDAGYWDENSGGYRDGGYGGDGGGYGGGYSGGGYGDGAGYGYNAGNDWNAAYSQDWSGWNNNNSGYGGYSAGGWDSGYGYGATNNWQSGQGGDWGANNWQAASWGGNANQWGYGY